MTSHGPIQWTCIAIVTTKVNVILKSSTQGIDGNVKIEQVYLLSSVIVVRSSIRMLLLSSTKLSTSYVPIRIKWMHFLYMREPSLKFVVLVRDMEHFRRQRPKISVSLQ
jgi:hypothetical protein